MSGTGFVKFHDNLSRCCRLTKWCCWVDSTMYVIWEIWSRDTLPEYFLWSSVYVVCLKQLSREWDVLFWNFTQRILVITYQCLGTSYWPHLQRSNSPWVWNYHSSLRKIPEERRSCLHCGGRLKCLQNILNRSCRELWKTCSRLSTHFSQVVGFNSLNKNALHGPTAFYIFSLVSLYARTWFRYSHPVVLINLIF